MKPLYDLQNEINRLYVAGSRFAINDPRLEKHITIFNKFGEKAPVFAKIASDIKELTTSNAEESALKLMNLGTLVYAVLYTQGNTVNENEQKAEQQPLFDIDEISTELTYFEIKPVLKALVVSGSNRIEVLEEAFKKNIFADFRTHRYLITALSDKNIDVAKFVEEKIIPKIGKPILPLLKKQFVLEDFAVNTRILRLLINLDDESLHGIVNQIFQENLPKLQAEAVFYLAKDKNNEAYIEKLCEDKNKLVREAALKALASMNSDTAVDKINSLYINLKVKSNAKLKPLIDAISLIKSKFGTKIYDKLNDTFLEIENFKDVKNLIENIETFSIELNLLKNKDVDQTYAFIEKIWLNPFINQITEKDYYKSRIDVFNDYEFQAIKNQVATIHETVKDVLWTLPVEKVVAFYSKHKEHISSDYSYQYFKLFTTKDHDKKQAYEIFNQWFDQNISSGDLIGTYQYDKKTTFDKIDLLWNEKAMEINKPAYNDLLLSHFIEPENSTRFNERLVNYFNNISGQNYLNENLYAILIDRNTPNNYELIIEELKKFGQYSYFHVSDQLRKILLSFPKEYGQKLREIAEYRKSKKYDFETLMDFADQLEKN